MKDAAFLLWVAEKIEIHGDSDSGAHAQRLRKIADELEEIGPMLKTLGNDVAGILEERLGVDDPRVAEFRQTFEGLFL